MDLSKRMVRCGARWLGVCLGCAAGVGAPVGENGNSDFGPPESRTRVQWQILENRLVVNIEAEGWLSIPPSNAPAARTADGVQTEFGLVLDADSDDWEGEALALVVDVNGDGERFHALLLDHAGACRGLQLNVLDWWGEWQARAEVEAQARDGRFSARVSLPVAAFGVEPGAGDRWRVAAARRTSAGGGALHSASVSWFDLRYGPDARRWGWSRLPIPDRTLAVAPPPEDVRLVAHSVGACDPACPDENVAVFTLERDGDEATDIRLTVRDPGGALLGSVEKRIRPGQRTVLATPYQVGAGTRSATFTLHVGGRVLHRSVHAVADRLPSRVFPLAGTYDTNRLARVTNAVAPQIGMTWSQLEQPQRGAVFARRVGSPWIPGQLFAWCREERLIPWMMLDRTRSTYNDVGTHIGAVRREGVKISLGSQGWEHRYAEWMGMGLYNGYLADPEQIETYFKNLRNGLAEYGDDAAAVFFMDEPYFQLRKRTVELFQRHRELGDYPYVEEIDQEVRERFGFGRHGIPESPDDDNPLRWIALKRWANAFVDDLEKRFVSEVRSIRPDLPLFSSDLVGDMISADLTRWRDGRFDIHLMQVNNHFRPNALNGVVGMRILHDLARTEELWGCTHLENSRATYTPREQHSLYSHYFRNGMTGLHTWPIGGREPWMVDVRYSRPDAWRYFLEAAQAMAGSGVRVPLPETADLAVYVSELSQMSIPGSYDWVGFVEPAYTVLAAGLNARMTFISDAGVDRGVFNPVDHRLIVVPFLPFVTESSAAALLDAVEQGATLFVADPQAFGRLPDGTVPIALRRRAMGVGAIEETAEQQRLVRTEQAGFLRDTPPLALTVPPPTLLGMLGATHRFVPGEDDIVLARYPDGGAAAIERRVGKGRVIATGFNPWFLTSNHPVSWDPVPNENLAFFAALLETHTIARDDAAGSVALPAPTPAEPPDRICISGNAVHFARTLTQSIHNADVGLRYALSPLPDKQPDVQAENEGWMPRGQGRLTDRFAALRDDERVTSVSWTAAHPVDLVVDLSGLRAIAQVKLFVAGQHPETTVFGSRNGTDYEPLATVPAREGEPVVAEIAFGALPGEWRRLKLRIHPILPLELIELEVWEPMSR